MTVAEMIAKLSTMNPEAIVKVWNEMESDCVDDVRVTESTEKIDGVVVDIIQITDFL
jgi:ribulose 1,5-bisphosphate synthetase/thiazole synthase